VNGIVFNLPRVAAMARQQLAASGLPGLSLAQAQRFARS
jgi:hypothetical protein